MRKLLIICITLMLSITLMGTAMAETIVLYGTVANIDPQSVVCTAVGTIQQVYVSAGDRIADGELLASITTNKVYATTDGTVYLFGKAGDQVSDIVTQYGAVAYIAPSNPYTITAAALDRNDITVSVTPGETVYLKCYRDGRHTGIGILAKLEKNKYTVVVTEGEFAAGETISIYRDPAYADQSRIGRARVTIADLSVYKGDGYLVKFHVQNGMNVKKGALLYETIGGNFAPGSTQLDKVTSHADGIVSSVLKSPGSQLNKAEITTTTVQETSDKKNAAKDTSSSVSISTTSQVIAEVYPDSGLRIVASAPESVLNEIHVNDTVFVSYQYIENMAEPIVGTVEKISRMPSAESAGVEAQYTVYVTVTDTSAFYYGMNVVVAIE